MGTRLIEKLLTFLFDIGAINAALFATYWLRFKSGIFPETFNPALQVSDYFPFPALHATVLWILLFFFTGLYRNWYKESRLDEFFVVTRTVLFGIFCLFLIISADEIIKFLKTSDKPILFTRTQLSMLSTYGLSMLFFAAMNRFAMHTFLAWLFSKGIYIKKVLVIGANDSGIKLALEIEKYRRLGHRVVGFIDDDGRKKSLLCAGIPVFGTYSDLPEIIKRMNVGGIIISHVSTSANEIMRILNYCGDSNVTIYMVPTLMDVISGQLKTHHIFGVPLIVLLQDHLPSWKAQIKRIFDVVIASAVLVAGLPFWVLCALLIRLTSRGAAIYKQERIGQNGKPFIMMKFRSMYSDAEKHTGPIWASENDPRITPIGRILRKTRLDEIPQFVNVLKGEMSIVGPRPERAYFIEKMKQEIPWYVRRIKMKPGITGWAQVKHKYDATIDDVKQKVFYDLNYFENMSLLLDIKIIIRTIMVIFTGKGAR